MSMLNTGKALPLQIRGDSKLTQAFFEAGLVAPESEGGAAVQMELLTYPFLVELMNDFLFSYFRQKQEARKDSLAKYIIFRFLLKCVDRSKAAFEAWRFLASIAKFQDTEVEVKIFVKFADFEYDHFVADFYQKVRRMVIQLVNGDVKLDYKRQIRDLSDLYLTTDQIVQIAGRAFAGISRNFSNSLTRIVGRLEIALSGDNDTLPALDFIHECLLEFQRLCVTKQQESQKKLEKLYLSKTNKLFYKNPHILLGEVDLSAHQTRVNQIHQANQLRKNGMGPKQQTDAYGQPIIDPNDFAPERSRLEYNPLPSREQVKKAAKQAEKRAKAGLGGTTNPQHINQTTVIKRMEAKTAELDSPPAHEVNYLNPQLATAPQAFFGAVGAKGFDTNQSLSAAFVTHHTNESGRLEDTLTLERGIASGLVAAPFGSSDFKVRELQEICLDQRDHVQELKRENFRLKKQLENKDISSPNRQLSRPFARMASDKRGKDESFLKSMKARSRLGTQGLDVTASSAVHQKGVVQEEAPKKKEESLIGLISNAHKRKPKWMQRKGGHRPQTSLFIGEQPSDNSRRPSVQPDPSQGPTYSKHGTMVFHDSASPSPSPRDHSNHSGHHYGGGGYSNDRRATRPEEFPTLGQRASHSRTHSPHSPTKSKASAADSYLKQLADENNANEIEERIQTPVAIDSMQGQVPTLPPRDPHGEMESEDSDEEDEKENEWLNVYSPGLKVPEQIDPNIIIDEEFYDLAMREGSIRMFEVQANFEATDDRCLKLQKGDVVYGFYEFQGWMFGFKKDQESEYGFFPPTYVKLLEF